MCFFVLGLILRHCLRMPLRLQSLAACLLVVAYFSHPLPVLVSFLFPLTHFIAEAIIQRRDGWRSSASALTRHAFDRWPWAAPACLILWYYLRLAKATEPRPYSVTNILKHRTIVLVRDAVLSISLTPGVGTLFILLLGLLLAGLFLRARNLSERDRLRFTSLTVLIVSTMTVYLVVPYSVGDGSWIPARFLLYSAFFLVLLALTGGVFDARFLPLCSLVAGLSVAGFAGEYLIVSKLLAPAVAELRVAMEIVPRHSRILILGYQMAPSCQGLPLLERSSPQYHTALGSTLENQLIVLNGTQAITSSFPLRSSGPRSFVSLDDEPSFTFEEKSANWYKLLRSDSDVDFVVSWGTPSGSTWCTKPVNPPFEEMLRIKHDLVFVKEGTSRVQLWRKRG